MREAAAASPREAVPDALDIRVAAPEDYAAIEAMSRAAPAQDVLTPLTAPLISWFVDKNPAGRGFVVLARDRSSGALAGHFVFYRWMLRHRGPARVVSVPAALYVRLYVRPEFRRRGAFAAMTRFGLARLAEDGVPLAYTAPNPKSSAGFIKFGMARRGPLPFYVRPSLPGWGWIGGTGRAARAIRVERRDRFDDRFAGELDAGPPTARWWGARPADLLNWRFADRPDTNYEIRYLVTSDEPAGYLVTRRMRIKGLEALVVCDYWHREGHEAALRAGLDAARADGKRTDLAMAIGGTVSPSFARASRLAGFLPCPQALLPQPVVVFGGSIGGTPDVPLPSAEEWHITPYDWDVF